MKTCSKCNSSYDDDKKFCKKCGNLLTSENLIDPKNVGKKTVLEERLKADPLNLELLTEYAQFLFNNLLFKETITVSFKILAIKENDSFSNELLFKSYLKLNMFKEALEIGNKLLAERPTDIFFLEELANISHELGNSEKAREYYDKILILQPSNTIASLKKAQILLKSNQVEDAIEIFKRIYQEGKKDRITTIYVGIDKVLSADYNTAINILSPILSDENINYKDLDNTHGLIYLAFSLCQIKADINEITQWFLKIDSNEIKNGYHILYEEILAKTILYITEYKLNNIKSSPDPRSNIDNLENIYINKFHFTTISNIIISEIWCNFGKIRADLKLYVDSSKSYEKALKLLPNDNQYKERKIEIIKRIAEISKKRKRFSIVATVVGIIIGLIIIGTLIFPYIHNTTKKIDEAMLRKFIADQYIEKIQSVNNDYARIFIKKDKLNLPEFKDVKSNNRLSSDSPQYTFQYSSIEYFEKLVTEEQTKKDPRGYPVIENGRPVMVNNCVYIENIKESIWSVIF